MADPESAATTPAWGAEHAAIARCTDYVPLLLGGVQALFHGFLQRRWRDCLFVVLAVTLAVCVFLAWPILFCLKVDGTTSMSWMMVWVPLWIADGIALWFFAYLVSWGRIKAPPGWEGEWRDPYPIPMRILELVKWCLLVLFQVVLVRRLDRQISWSWEEVSSPLVAWAGLQYLGELYRILCREAMLMTFATFACALMKVTVETTLLILEVVFLIWRLDGKVDWSWWVVFIPLWLFHAGEMMSCGSTSATHYSYNGEVEFASEASTNCGFNFNCSGGAPVVASILAVALIAGADFTAFYVFLPQFIVVGVFIVWIVYFACAHGVARLQQETEGSSTEQV